MQEEKSFTVGAGSMNTTLRRPQMLGPTNSNSSTSSLSSTLPAAYHLAQVENRLAAQIAQATSALPLQQNSDSGVGPLPTNLPSSSGGGTTHLRNAASASASSSGVDQLDWADMQFKRAGVNTAAQQALHAVPIQTLGMQQRVKHAQMFSVVEKMREGQQHIFLEQFNQFPNVESHSTDDYSKIWHAFKTKDEEAQHIISKLNGLCENIDALSKHATHNNPHQ